LSKELLGSLELNRIYQFDCVQGMRFLPENCIDLTVTSPPYDNLRNYNGYSFDFNAVANELVRITKEGGVVVWVVSDKQGLHSSKLFILRKLDSTYMIQ
jgi:DNA modification methylase